MHDYPYSLSTGYGATQNEGVKAYFKTKKDAIKYVEKHPDEFRGVKRPRIFLGEDAIRVPDKSNFGYEDYLNADRHIQTDLKFNEKYGNKYAISPSSPSSIKAKNTYANSMYKDDYDQLNEWQKEDVDLMIKNDKAFKESTNEYNELDDIFDELDNTYVNPLQLDATPAQIQKFKNEGVSYNSVADDFMMMNTNYLLQLNRNT